MLPRLLLLFAVVWFLSSPTRSCLINNCPQGGKRSEHGSKRSETKFVDVQMRALEEWSSRKMKSCTYEGNLGPCVGPLCCPLGSSGKGCFLDEFCGTDMDQLEEYTLCMLPGLYCQENTGKCCNAFDRNRSCFESAKCRVSGNSEDDFKANNIMPMDMSRYIKQRSV